MTTDRFVIELRTQSSGVLHFGAGYCKSTALRDMHILAQFLDFRDLIEISLSDLYENSVIDLILFEDASHES